jgi:Phosphoenolpyruvate carboxykinase C-terminal P-loop domain
MNGRLPYELAPRPSGTSGQQRLTFDAREPYYDHILWHQAHCLWIFQRPHSRPDPQAGRPTRCPDLGALFGGRRRTTAPLVYEAFNWTRALYLAETLGSETTAAAVGKKGVVRRDPFAHAALLRLSHGDYFAHWIPDLSRSGKAAGGARRQ